jgi:hypothetical protein
MFTKDYTLLVGLKYCIKLSTKLLSKGILSVLYKTFVGLGSRGALGSPGSRSHVTSPRSHLEFSVQAVACRALSSKFARGYLGRNIKLYSYI